MMDEGKLASIQRKDAKVCSGLEHMPKEEGLRQQCLFNLLKRSLRSHPIPVLQPSAGMLKRYQRHLTFFS